MGMTKCERLAHIEEVPFAQLPKLTKLESEALRTLVEQDNMWSQYSRIPEATTCLEGAGCIVVDGYTDNVAVTHFGLRVYKTLFGE
jgi:hypothetical protein